MRDSTFYSYLRKFGFGRAAASTCPEESVGILSPARDWTKAKHATTSFGQGVSVNAMQMVRAVGAIANGGVMCDAAGRRLRDEGRRLGREDPGGRVPSASSPARPPPRSPA